jgi:molybdenum cofactor guanylyltransferase
VPLRILGKKVENLMQPSLDLSAIVLAGGQSSRMGRDKALLEVAGVPMLRRVCEAALHCTDRVYVVTGWGDRYQTILPLACSIVTEIPLPEQTELAGPLVGFAQGLVHVNTEWVLLLACDLPQLTGAVLQAWSTQVATVSAGAIALLPRSNQGWEPLCGFYRRSGLGGLVPFIAAGGRSFQRWLREESVQELAIANPHMLFNCNTPQDFNRLGDVGRDERDAN